LQCGERKAALFSLQREQRKSFECLFEEGDRLRDSATAYRQGRLALQSHELCKQEDNLRPPSVKRYEFLCNRADPKFMFAGANEVGWGF
jgi:hypothetical protein